MGWLALCSCPFFAIQLNLKVNTNLSDVFEENPLQSVQDCCRRPFSEVRNYFLCVIMLLGCVFLTSMLETNVKPVRKLTDGFWFFFSG